SLNDGNLCWLIHPPKFKKTGTGMFSRFIDLHRADDEELLKYAKDWGVFGLCSHGLPASHSHVIYGASHGYNPCEFTGNGTEFVEDLAVWRRFSAAADAVIQIAAQLNMGRVEESEDVWRRLLTGPIPLDFKFGDIDLVPINRPLRKSEI